MYRDSSRLVQRRPLSRGAAAGSFDGAGKSLSTTRTLLDRFRQGPRRSFFTSLFKFPAAVAVGLACVAGTVVVGLLCRTQLGFTRRFVVAGCVEDDTCVR